MPPPMLSSRVSFFVLLEFLLGHTISNHNYQMFSFYDPVGHGPRNITEDSEADSGNRF